MAGTLAIVTVLLVRLIISDTAAKHAGEDPDRLRLQSGRCMHTCRVKNQNTLLENSISCRPF